MLNLKTLYHFKLDFQTNRPTYRKHVVNPRHQTPQVLWHIHGDKGNNHGIYWTHDWFDNYGTQFLIYVPDGVPVPFTVVTELQIVYVLT